MVWMVTGNKSQTYVNQLPPVRRPSDGKDVSELLSRWTKQKKLDSNKQSSRSGLSFLASDDLPAWDALVDGAQASSIFCKSWWLKAACGEARILGYFEAGQLIAGIPLFYGRRMGLQLCCMPRLTQTMGVVLAPLAGKRVTVQSRETEILDIFAARLAEEPVFMQAFHPAIQNWLPFYWHGFTQVSHYTYVLDDLSSMKQLWNNLAPVRRTNIRKAQRCGVRLKECGPDTVFRVAVQTFERQKRACPYSHEYLSRLYQAAKANDAGICFAAEDSAGQVHAASFFVWDRNRGYYIAGGYNPLLASSGAPVFLMWNLIEFGAAHTSVFDFEGSMQRQIEASFRTYGARRIAYSRISKLPRWLRVAFAATGRYSF